MERLSRDSRGRRFAWQVIRARSSGGLPPLPRPAERRAGLDHTPAEQAGGDAEDQGDPRICQASATMCGIGAGNSAARPNIAKGEDKGNTIPATALGLSGWPTPRLARPKIIICAIVTGIDSVCTSRAVEADRRRRPAHQPRSLPAQGVNGATDRGRKDSDRLDISFGRRPAARSFRDDRRN